MAVAQGIQTRKGVGAKRSYRFRYDFAVQGGAAGAITLTDAVSGSALVLPDNFEITAAYTVAITAMTSGGSSTVKLGITGNDDCFVAATAYNHASWDVADDISARNAEVPLKTSAAVSVLATIATADLTAGKFDVIVEGYEGA
jgi:hypothetical protein